MKQQPEWRRSSLLDTLADVSMNTFFARMSKKLTFQVDLAITECHDSVHMAVLILRHASTQQRWRMPRVMREFTAWPQAQQ